MPRIPQFLSGRFYLITGSRAITYHRMQALVVQGALRGRVRLLIAGNRFGVYDIAYQLATMTGDYWDILENQISLSRAETYYQVVELLRVARTSPTLTLVSDLLVTFEDESVPEMEIDQLLFEAILALRRMRDEAPVVVSAHPGQERPRLFNALAKAADEIEHLNEHQPNPPITYQFI